MSAQQIALIAAAALLVFWSLGAYNRLVALRNRIGAAFVPVDDALRRRAAALAVEQNWPDMAIFALGNSDDLL